MKQVAQNYKSGTLELIEVPVPRCSEGGVVVRTEFSLISAGTELMKVGEAQMSLLGKAKARPEQVKKVLESVGQQGISATYRKVMSRLDSYTPLGYSLSGVVVESRVPEIPTGSRVACGGNDQALHAEFNFVPKNLCVLVPDGVKSEHAAFATVGAVAMHGFRQSEAALGETVVVIGLGLLGQLLTQIAVAAGVTVIGLDPSPERCKLAVDLGADHAGPPDSTSVRDHLNRVTSGHGADVVFLAAGTNSNEPVHTAASIARDRARIVDLGKLPLDLPWKEYYEKELEVRFSRSYGPGRYDPRYELEGVDYPIGYVRWTERRNMESFVALLERQRLNLDPLIGEIAPFESAVETYEKLASGGGSGVATLFSYRADAPLVRDVAATKGPRSAPTRDGAVRLAVIGAGNYASSMLLPFLAGNPDVSLEVVATSTALSGATATKRFGFARSTTDYEQALDGVDAVLIATRHDTHARIAATALSAGKAVFVEKPLAITTDDLEIISGHLEQNDRLMVGFNRRFSPLLGWLRETLGEGEGVARVDYSINASDIQAGSWYADSRTQGTRFAGEGGHFIDTLSWWLGEDPIDVMARTSESDPDGIEVILAYPGGSLGSISYTTRGSGSYPKETLVASGGGVTARLDNFREATVWRGRKKIDRSARKVDKGQAGELAAFVDAVKTGAPMPISAHSLLATTEATLAAVDSGLGAGHVIPLKFR